MPVYTIHNLTKIYKGRPEAANRAITFQIEEGEIFGMLGDNGAGKSTLVRQMVNLLRPTSGTITLYGQPLDTHPTLVPQLVGYMPQDGLALNNLTVAEALYFTAHLRGLTRSAAQAERDRLLARWQRNPQRDQPIPRLSGGQRRLLQIAIAMAGSPPILILDEPTANLDPQRRKQVWEVLREENAAHGTTIIFITHDAVEAEKVIDRVAILRAGELVALGRPLDLKRQVDHQLRLELFFPPDAPPLLPVGLAYRDLAPGRWLVYLDRSQAAAILQTLDLTRLDDFRLYSATLEDLYLYYATHP
jgi:ABC-type multidrug transport system ATPase subunit